MSLWTGGRAMDRYGPVPVRTSCVHCACGHSSQGAALPCAHVCVRACLPVRASVCTRASAPVRARLWHARVYVCVYACGVCCVRVCVRHGVRVCTPHAWTSNSAHDWMILCVLVSGVNSTHSRACGNHCTTSLLCFYG